MTCFQSSSPTGTQLLPWAHSFYSLIPNSYGLSLLHYDTGSWTILMIIIIWLYDGNVQYFTRDHIPRFVAAAFILIAGGLFTVLLFFGQWFPRCSKVMICTNNTKYIGFMDAYHAPFTPKHRYWVGLLLFALIIHNIVAAMAPDTSFPILYHQGFYQLDCMIVWKLLNKCCGSLETLYLFNVAILAFGAFFVKKIQR